MLDLLLFGQKTAPDFFWDARSGVLPPGGSFTRASSGWYFDSTGILVSASSNVARFDYDPVTLQPWGYLPEMQSTNIIVRSQALTGASWNNNVGVTVTDNAVASPDGTANAATVKESSATSIHKVGDTVSLSAAAGAVYGFSFFAKNISGSRWAQLFMAGVASVNFNPSDGSIGSVNTSAGYTITSASARNIGNGWWRFSYFFSSAAGNGGIEGGVGLVTASNSGSQQSYAGDGTSAVAVWGIQFETAGVGVTSYIPTAGSTVTRSADILSLPLASLPGWRASLGGVLVATYRLHTVRPAGFQSAIGISDVGGSNFVELSPAENGTVNNQMRNAGSVQFSIGSAVPLSPFVRGKIAGGWSTARGQLATDGGNLVTAAGTYLLPTSRANLNIGWGSGSDYLNGTIESIAYYAGARSDAFVQAVSR